MTKLTPVNLRNSVTVAGQVGNFPSILNPLDGSDLGVDLPGLSADVEEGVYQYWKRDGSRVTGTIFDAGLIVPGTSTQSFSSGLYRRFRVEGDPALLPGSIKAGTTIFGVGGQFPSQEYPLSEAMGSDLPHLSSTLAAGSYQWWKQDGTRVTGNILSASGGGSITPGTSTQVFDAGVYRAFSVLGDSALLPSSIVNSVAIFGVPGTAIESYMPTPEGPLVSTTVRASCAAHLTSGETSSGRYLIDPDGAAGPAPIMEGQCDMTTDGGGMDARSELPSQGFGDVTRIEIVDSEVAALGRDDAWNRRIDFGCVVGTRRSWFAGSIFVVNLAFSMHELYWPSFAFQDIRCRMRFLHENRTGLLCRSRSRPLNGKSFGPFA
jgi:hypothetical protein